MPATAERRLLGLTFADDGGLLRKSANQPSANQPRKVEPMENAYEIYAIRYATMSPRTPHLNFLLPDPHETAAQDLDYFVWLIRGSGGRDILVGTGVHPVEGAAGSRN